MANKNQFSELDIDIEKGMLMGEGVDLRKQRQKGESLEKVFVPWSDLNSHFMCYGTTRMGKTRLMMFMMRQIIEKGDHLLVVEPKGSEEQEVVSWVYQYANEFNSIADVMYWSPERTDMSIKINMLYGQNDEVATGTVLSAMKVEEEFFEDVANEILMALFPAFSFIQKCNYDGLVLEIMERKEYIKAKLSDPLNAINKQMMGGAYDERRESVKDTVVEDMIAGTMDTDEIKRINAASSIVNQIYSGTLTACRKFVTFEDLARYANQDSFIDLHNVVEATIKKLGKTKYDLEKNQVLIQEGEKVLRSLAVIRDGDKGFFSKVTKSFAVTMAKLSTGNMGELLCGSKINILSDEFYIKNKRVILIAQPFPMIYPKVANMAIRMLMAMLNRNVAQVGVTGVANYKRMHVMVDEAGSISSELMLSLVNKGGGLGLSLYLFSQSFADYDEALGEKGAVILADNANSKGFFLVNDETSAESVSSIIGSAKKGDVTYGSNEGTTARNQSKATEEALIPPHLVSQLPKMTYVMKTGSRVFMMAAPFQRDPYLEVRFPYEDTRRRAEKFNDFVEGYSNAR